MKAKLAITAALILALATIPVQPARAQVKSNFELVECVVVVVVVGVGLTIVVGLYKMCKRIHLPPTNSAPTNTLTAWPMTARALGDSPTIALQSAATLNAPFNDEVTFSFAQDGLTMNAVAYRNGQPIATNSAAVVVTNGEATATLDFTALASVITNTGKFFRLAQ